ncbi:unnamed protein product [Eretmochelys imbricata]
MQSPGLLGRRLYLLLLSFPGSLVVSVCGSALKQSHNRAGAAGPARSVRSRSGDEGAAESQPRGLVCSAASYQIILELELLVPERSSPRLPMRNCSEMIVT